MKNFGKIKNIFILTLLVVVGFCFFVTSKAEAIVVSGYGIRGVDHLANGTYSVSPGWSTDVLPGVVGSTSVIGYSSISYGPTSSLGTNTRAYNDNNAATTEMFLYHDEFPIGNLANSEATIVYMQLGAFDSGGAAAVSTSVFAVKVGAPYLKKIYSTSNNTTYGPNSQINITAVFSEALAPGSTMTVSLNNGGSASMVVGADNTTMTGTYTVGTTGSGQSISVLTASSITGENNVCDIAGTCIPAGVGNNNYLLPPPKRPNTHPGYDADVEANYGNLGENNTIVIDATAPTLSSVSPAASTYINSTTSANGGSDISYTLSEAIASGSITFTRTGGTADASSPRTCTLTGTALNTGAHAFFDTTTGCSGGAITLVDGAIYTVAFSATDLYGNVSATTSRTSVTYDITAPTLDSFTSSTVNGTYGPNATINVTATYSETLSTTLTSSFAVALNTGASTSSGSRVGATLLGTYTVGATGSGQNTTDLTVSSITSQNACDRAGNCLTTTTIPGTNIATGSDIQIDTTAPNAPTGLSLTNPVNSANQTTAVLSLNAEANMTAYYSITSSGGGTAVSGNSAMGASTSKSITVNVSGLNDGTLTATVYMKDSAGNNSANATTTATKDATAPYISSITSTTVDGNYKAGDSINVTVNFSENVTSTGDVIVTMETGQTDGACTLTLSNASSGSCNFNVIAEYFTNNLQAKSITLAEGATLRDLAENDADLATINNNLAGRTIRIDMSAPVLNSLSSTTENGTYGPTSAINLTANYSDTMGEGSSLVVVLNSGAEVTLNSVEGDKLVGIYTVGSTGSGQNVSDLTVASITSQNACDTDNNCLVNTVLPETNNNIGANSAIAIDTTAPSISSILPLDNSKITSVAVDSNISYSLSETLASGSIKVEKIEGVGTVKDSDSPHMCTLQGDSLKAGVLYNPHSNFNTKDCVEGEDGTRAMELVPGVFYTFTFTGFDSYGNKISVVVNNVAFIIDVDAPTIVSCSVSDITSTTAKINWTTDKTTDATVYYKSDTGLNEVIIKSDVWSESHSIEISELTPATHYTFNMESTALSNSSLTIKSNSSNSECSDFYTLSNIEDTTAPVITNVSADPVTSRGATINWTTNEVADSYVNYGETTDYNHKSYGNKDKVTTHNIILPSDLKPSTLYHYQVTSADSSGNIGVSDDYQFTTLPETDTGEDDGGNTSPALSNIKASTTAIPNSMLITWTTDKNANGFVNYGLDTAYDQAAADSLTIDPVTNFSTSHSVTLNNLLSNTKYNFQVVSYSTGGKVAASDNQAFSTAILQLASEPKVTNANTKSAIVIWETVNPSFSGLEYGTTTSYGKTFQDAILANMHRVELTGLQANQVYHFKIKGGKSSDLIYSKDYMFGTFIKPVVSNFTTSEIKDISALVKWSVSVPSESYVEYQNVNDPEDKGTQGVAGLQTDNQVTLNGLTQGSKYAAKIKGIDVNKNDFESTEVNFETLIDTTPPEISQVNTDSSLVTGKEDKVQTIVSWKTDEVATSQVIFDIGGNSEGELTQKSKEDANLTTNHLVVLTNLKPGMVYHFKVLSKDKNANLKESQDFTLLTPRKSQSVIQMIIANFEQSFGFLKKLRN